MEIDLNATLADSNDLNHFLENSLEGIGEKGFNVTLTIECKNNINSGGDFVRVYRQSNNKIIYQGFMKKGDRSDIQSFPIDTTDSIYIKIAKFQFEPEGNGVKLESQGCQITSNITRPPCCFCKDKFRCCEGQGCDQTKILYKIYPKK